MYLFWFKYSYMRTSFDQQIAFCLRLQNGLIIYFLERKMQHVFGGFYLEDIQHPEISINLLRVVTCFCMAFVSRHSTW